MIRSDQIMEFCDALFDAGVATGFDRIGTVGALLPRVVSEPQRWLMEQRAAAASDLYHLRGISLARIARAAKVTPQSVSLWLQEHGPERYVVIHPATDTASFVGRQRLVVDTVAVSSESNKTLLGYEGIGPRRGASAAEIATMARKPGRVVPAERMLYDNATGVLPFDAEQVWAELGNHDTGAATTGARLGEHPGRQYFDRDRWRTIENAQPTGGVLVRVQTQEDGEVYAMAAHEYPLRDAPALAVAA